MAYLEVYEEKRSLLSRRRKQWRWRIKASNNRIIATSGEGYTNKRDLWNAISKIRNVFVTVAIPIGDE